MSAKHESVATQLTAEHERALQLETQLEEQQRVSEQQRTPLSCAWMCCVPCCCSWLYVAAAQETSMFIRYYPGTAVCLTKTAKSQHSANLTFHCMQDGTFLHHMPALSCSWLTKACALLTMCIICKKYTVCKVVQHTNAFVGYTQAVTLPVCKEYSLKWPCLPTTSRTCDMLARQLTPSSVTWEGAILHAVAVVHLATFNNTSKLQLESLNC